jgi:hypothetical protein
MKEPTEKEIEERTCPVCGGLEGFDEGCDACQESTYFEVD